jgi:hypothetical protein
MVGKNIFCSKYWNHENKPRVEEWINSPRLEAELLLQSWSRRTILGLEAEKIDCPFRPDWELNPGQSLLGQSTPAEKIHLFEIFKADECYAWWGPLHTYSVLSTSQSLKSGLSVHMWLIFASIYRTVQKGCSVTQSNDILCPQRIFSAYAEPRVWPLRRAFHFNFFFSSAL